MSGKTFGELFRERYVIKPDCFGNINIESDKCGRCSVTGQCFNEYSKSDSKQDDDDLLGKVLDVDIPEKWRPKPILAKDKRRTEKA